MLAQCASYWKCASIIKCWFASAIFGKTLSSLLTFLTLAICCLSSHNTFRLWSCFPFIFHLELSAISQSYLFFNRSTNNSFYHIPSVFFYYEVLILKFPEIFSISKLFNMTQVLDQFHVFSYKLLSDVELSSVYIDALII